MSRGLAALALVACSGGGKPVPAGPTHEAPVTVADKLLAILPQGAQVVVELDLARLRGNPVVGDVITRAFADRKADLVAGVPASPLAVADHVVLAAYGVGTAQAATLTLLAASGDVPGATRVGDGVFAVGPADWVEQVEQRIALATTGDAKFALSAPAELLALRDHAMPPQATGAALRITARLPFDARIALARQTGLDSAPAQLSVWADVADDFAVIVDADAADPGNAKETKDAPRRLLATLRGALAAVAVEPTVRALGLPPSLADAKFVTRGTWIRTIIAVGPAHLKRVIDRADALLRAPS